MPELVETYERAASVRLAAIERGALGTDVAAGPPLYLAAVAKRVPDPPRTC